MRTSKLLLSVVLFFFINFSYAIDRVVQENGPIGTFQTIGEAIEAASDGDRIIIYPKVGDNPYVENIIIDKSLEFATAQDAVRYKIQGNITLVALNNRTITLIGAHITSGSISGSGTGWRTNVNIMNCLLEGGNINFNNQFYASIVSNSINSGNISISHGRVIGNEMLSDTESVITLSNSTSLIGDTIDVIANKCSRIACLNNDVFLNVFNNFIKRLSGTSTFYSFNYTFTDTNNIKVKFYNNTVLTPRTNSFNSGSANAYFRCFANADIKNNIFVKTSNNPNDSAVTFFNVTPNSAKSNNFYHLTDGQIISGSLNSQVLTNNPVNQTTGLLILPTPAENGAEQSFQFYDLDLTIGDAGCYGGSYSLDNYFPITGSSRVFSIEMPFGFINNGTPLEIKAEGFDR
jgi:hypothetical protein